MTLPAQVLDVQMVSKEPETEGESAQQIDPRAARIPKEVMKGIEQDLVSFLRTEIAAARTERADFMTKIARWRLVYDAPMPKEAKRFPFLGASNLTLPVVKESVNTLTAQIVQATMTAKPRWVFEDLAPEWEPFVDELQTFMNIASERDMKVDEAAVPWIIQIAKLGTGILEVGYEVDIREQYQVTADGTKAYPKEHVAHDGPMTYHVSLEDFFIRFGERSIQRARWCSKILRYNEIELKEKGSQKKFSRVDEVLNFKPPEADKSRKVQEETEKTKPIERKQFEIHEVWIRWPLKKGGRYTDIRVYYHEDSGIILAAEFHPYWHNMRPFIKEGYFPMDGRFYDQGLCEMLEQIQEAISARYNQRSDNITIAGLKMFLKRKGVKGLMPGDPLYAGKQIEVLDPQRDIVPLQMGEIYPSTVQEEIILREYGERLSGLNEGVIGSAMPVTRTTASAQLALLQEQAKRIDLTVRSVRNGLNGVGQQGILLYQQFGTNGKAIAWMGERGRVVEAVFRLPRRIVELGMGIRSQVPTSLQNKQVKRENSLAMYNLLVQMYKEMIPMAQALAPEQLPNVVHAMVKGAQKFLGDVLETFDTSDPEEALAGLAVLERVLPRAEDLGGLESFSRSVESAEIIEKLGRVEDLLRAAETARDRTAGVPEPSRVPQRLPEAARGVPDVGADLLFGGQPSGFGGG